MAKMVRINKRKLKIKKTTEHSQHVNNELLSSDYLYIE